MTLEAAWDGPFLDTSLLSGNSHRPLRQAAENAGCRGPRMCHWLIAPSLIAVLAIIKPPALAEWKLQKEGVCVLVSLGPLQFPEHRPGRSEPPLRPLPHPPATAPEIDRRWQAGVGTAVGRGAKVAPFLAALLPPNHQFLEEGGCVSIFFSLWL